jgi:hypothetical protein
MIKFETSNDVDNYLMLLMQKKIKLKSKINLENLDVLMEPRMYEENLIDRDIL